MTAALRPALFLDRDGVINVDINYLHMPEDCVLIPGIGDLIRTANQLGFAVIVVTNQSGIGRGMYTEQQFHTLMDHMSAELAEEGAHIDAVYFSPFHPVHGIGHYKQDTDCRKPAPGMLLRAAQEHGLDPARSVLVGDRCSDLGAGAAAGVPDLYLFGTTEANPCQGVRYTYIQTLSPVIERLQALAQSLAGVI